MWRRGWRPQPGVHEERHASTATKDLDGGTRRVRAGIHPVHGAWDSARSTGRVCRALGCCPRSERACARQVDLERSDGRFVQAAPDRTHHANRVSGQDPPRARRTVPLRLHPRGAHAQDLERRGRVGRQLHRPSDPRRRGRIHLARSRGWKPRSQAWLLEGGTGRAAAAPPRGRRPTVFSSNSASSAKPRSAMSGCGPIPPAGWITW